MTVLAVTKIHGDSLHQRRPEQIVGDLGCSCSSPLVSSKSMILNIRVRKHVLLI